MKFLKNYTIDINAIPAYRIFKNDFTQDIDIHIAKLILDSNDPRVKEEAKTEFSKLVQCVDKKTNILKVQYGARYNLGRRYPSTHKPGYYSALVTQSKIIKNTIYKYQDYIDIDQKKAHPTLLLSIANKNGCDLETYTEYLNNFDEHLNELVEYYSIPNEQPLDKSDIKMLFNRTIYGGGYEGWCNTILTGKDGLDSDGEPIQKQQPKKMRNKNKPHPFYLQFKDETTLLIDVIYKSNLKLAEIVCADIPDDPNYLWKKKSRTMSYFCTILENEVTMQAYNFLLKYGYIDNKHIDWAYDGLTMPSFASSEKDLKIIMKHLNKYVQEKTGFSEVQFVVKPFDDDTILQDVIDKRNDMIIDENNFDVEDDTEEELPNIKSYQSVADEFEKTHCKIINRSVFIKHSDTENIIMSKRQILISYEHMSCDTIVETKKGQIIKPQVFINKWLISNQTQRQYIDMGVYPCPSLCPNNYFNLWIPFTMERITDYEENIEGLNIILKHIQILCDNDKEIYDYFCLWIGQMIKYPHIKSGICPTLISKEGAGKGSLLYLFSQMLGREKVFETTNPSRDVWGNFNGVMMNAFLVNLNELSKKETIEADGRIKGLITDSVLSINKKGVEVININSYHRFIVTTNSEEPISVKTDSRRHLIIRSSDELIGKKKYFVKLYALLNDMNVIKTCYEYFKNLDGVDTFTTMKPKVTEYQQDMQIQSSSPILKWLIDFVCEKEAKSKTLTMSNKECFDNFIEWTQSNKVIYEVNSISFALRLKRFKLNGLTKGRNKHGMSLTFDFEQLREELEIDKETDYIYEYE